MLVTVALMVFHGLIRLKRFVSRFPRELCNYFFRLRLVLHTRVQTFDVMGGGKKIFFEN
jgi:hypothetical protein